MKTEPFIFTLADIKNHNDDYIATIFSQANGSFGVRATNPLDYSTNGTLINGFYETSPITYGEKAYGYAENNQTIVDLPSLRAIKICLEDGQLLKYACLTAARYDMQDGQLEMDYELAKSAEAAPLLRLTLQTVVGQANQDLQTTLLKYTFSSMGYTGKIFVTKDLFNEQHDEQSADWDPRVSDRAISLAMTKTTHTATTVNRFTTQNSHQTCEIRTTNLTADQCGEQTLTITADRSVTLVYQIDVITNLTATENIVKFNQTEFLKRTTDFWRDFWNISQISIVGDEQLDKGLRYNTFQLCQSANRTGKYSIAAKGLSGSGYEGHFFWDTEMYMLPFFCFTNPKIARELLEFRYQLLPQAHQRAKELGVAEGALFAWRTINGQEASAYYPAGTAQYHIDADIAYAVGLYYQLTHDQDFMKEIGLPILRDTAIFWCHFGSWDRQHASFMFHDVTGPDEYTAIVDNNFYTNRMAKHNIDLFLSAYNCFGDSTLTEETIREMKEIAANIYLPFNQVDGITPQDDTFMNKPIWDVAKTPKSNFPLLLHYHPLKIYRYQVNKQPDVLLADMLFPEDKSTAAAIQDYDYYKTITTHDSSLSRSIFSVLAARLNRLDEAYEFYMDAALTDITDLQGNTKDGLHMANLGGSWLAIIYGFAGVTLSGDMLSITNHLPKKWREVTFNIVFNSCHLRIKLSQDKTMVSVLTGQECQLIIENTRQAIPLNQSVTVLRNNK